MRPPPIPIGIALILASATAPAQEAMPVKTVAMMKEATAYIRTGVDPDVDGPVVSGSGFVIRAEGTTGYIVTNAHVVAPPRDGGKFAARAPTKVYFRSGTKSEAEATAEVVASEPGRDLAILRVAGVPNLPAPIPLDSDTEPFETMTVYIFGFPFGGKLALGKGNPPVTVGRGQVSSVRRGEDDRLTSVLLDGALNPGNSGGPVVDARGRLVGVARATIRGANIGFAIAVPELLAMLDGKAESATLAVAPAGAEARVEVPLIDPLGRIKSARLLTARGEAKFSQTRRRKPAGGPAGIGDEDEDAPRPRAGRDDESETVFGPLDGAESLPLTIGGPKATGVIKILPTGGDVALWCQVAIVDGAGKTVHAKPGRWLFGAGRPGEPTLWGEAVDPDGDCGLKTEGGELVCEVPGTLHDLNIDIGKNNGPRVVREVDGDFSARVRVAGSFRPGPERTGPKSVPYNGGGLLAWLDDGSYIRLERGAMHRNGRVVGLIDFESREGGTRVEAHNKGGLDPARDLWLRLERRGGVISGALSQDGRDWEELRPIEVDWPARLKVGVDAVNSCGDPMTVRFRDYSLTGRPPAGDRPASR